MRDRSVIIIQLLNILGKNEWQRSRIRKLQKLIQVNRPVLVGVASVELLFEDVVAGHRRFVWVLRERKLHRRLELVAVERAALVRVDCVEVGLELRLRLVLALLPPGLGVLIRYSLGPLARCRGVPGRPTQGVRGPSGERLVKVRVRGCGWGGGWG